MHFFRKDGHVKKLWMYTLADSQRHEKEDITYHKVKYVIVIPVRHLKKLE